MASAISHAVTALSLGTVFPQRQLPRRWLLLGMACAVVPDVDVLGFHYGIHYGDLLGHRGITHSLAFALVLAVVIAVCARSRCSDLDPTAPRGPTPSASQFRNTKAGHRGSR